MQISEFQLWIHEFILLIMSKDKSFIDNEVSDYTHEMRALSKIIGEIQLVFRREVHTCQAAFYDFLIVLFQHF